MVWIRSVFRLLFLGYRQFVVDKFQMLLTMYRHSGMILAGIHHKQRLKTWIPAKTFAGMTVG
jgi:hypothetical protein